MENGKVTVVSSVNYKHVQDIGQMSEMNTGQSSGFYQMTLQERVDKVKARSNKNQTDR